MREILFRGKPVNSEWWLENYDRFSSLEEWVIGNLIISDEIYWIVGQLVEANDEYLAHEWWVQVDPETVGQYAGTKIFNNGSRRIYVGDLFRYEDGSILEVIFEDRIGAFGAWRKDGEWLSMQSTKMWGELVGNKWDNPELLEVEE